MIKKDEFIVKTLKLIKKDLERELPEEGILDEMVEITSKVVKERFCAKGGKRR